MVAMLKSLWLYKGFIKLSIQNEFVSRFSRSGLGGLWMVLHPLSQVAIYALILSNVLAAKLPGIESKYAYALYLMAGFLAWNLFSEILSRCLNLFIEQGNLIKKMQFPRITLPVIVMGSSLLNNILLFMATILIFTLLGQGLSAQVFWLIPLTILVVALALGFGLLLGVLNVFIRDIGQAVPIILQIWFWFTPIVYPVHIIPDYLKDIMGYNLMFAVVSAYQNILVYGTEPEWNTLSSIMLLAVVLMGLSLFTFRRASPEMVDVL
jgi:lipopolysaccharide transport system permease protein